MKKLLQINTVVNYGSTGRIAEQIGKLAISKGIESYIAYGRKEGNNSSSKLIKIENKIGNYLHVAKTRLTDKHGLGSTIATKKLIGTIEKLNPDVIHLHNIHGYYLNYKVLFDFLNNSEIPVVWTLHDCWTFTGHCSYFDYVGCSKWKSSCHSCPQSKSYPKSFIDNSKFNFKAKATAFGKKKNIVLIPVSNWLKQLLKDSILSQHEANVIHNGVDLKNFKPFLNNDLIDAKYNTIDKFIILGVASVWEKRKGLDDFIALSKMLEANQQIILVGLNENQLQKIPENIIGIERTNSIEELAQLYSRANVFFNPTYEDNFPTTNLEAMACGTPIITYNTGGSPECITPNTGFVVEQGDLKDTLSKIKTIQQNQKTFYLINCVQNIQVNFEMEAQFEKYFKVYDTLTANT